MIVRSPRPSDGTEATCLFPVHPVKTYVFPWLVPGVQNPSPRQDANMSPFTDVQSAWTFSPPKEKIQFSKMGWAQARWALVFPQSHSPRAGSASGGKRGSVPKAARFHDLLPPSGSCRQPSMLYRDGSRMKRRRENVLTSHGHPTRETKDRTKSTGEVERLQDNRRGLKCGYLQQRL